MSTHFEMKIMMTNRYSILDRGVAEAERSDRLGTLAERYVAGEVPRRLEFAPSATAIWPSVFDSTIVNDESTVIISKA